MRFTQVNVFAADATSGNALAVVHDAQGLTDAQMAAFARWTQLAETTFLLPPTEAGADYRVRIFTTGGELPFAGHPTLGSAHAWLEAGGTPRTPGRLVQECGAGLVEVRTGERLAFAAPPLRRSGPVAAAEVADVVAALRVDPGAVRDSAWCDNGPGWLGLLLDSPERVLGLDPDPVAMAGRKVGVIAPYPPGSPADAEVRAFYADGRAYEEDPVTGSLNAALAQWLVPAGVLPRSYVAAQGSRLQRAGRLYLEESDGQVWVGGDVRTVVAGTVDLP